MTLRQQSVITSTVAPSVSPQSPVFAQACSPTIKRPGASPRKRRRNLARYRV